MAKLVLWIVLFVSVSASAVQLKFFKETTIPHKFKFQNTIIGGLSGIYYDKDSNHLVSVSDDRGKINEPRFYEFSITLNANEFKIEPQAEHFVFVGKMAHDKAEKNPAIGNLPAKVLDMEGITKLPWGSWLISSEGDNNQKPRVPPVLMDIKSDGSWARNFELPEKFIPEATGAQKKGIRNNKGPEGLTSDSSGKKFLVAMEAPLVQGDQSTVSFVEYNVSDAWVIKPGKEYFYPKVEDGILENGVSEVLFIDEHRLLVLERCILGFSKGELLLGSRIFLTDLSMADSNGKLKKVLVLDLATLKSQLAPPAKIENYEGMTWGPLIDGKRTVILVSDDNFMRNQRTHFLALKFAE